MIPSLAPQNGYSFGIKWSLVGCSLALVYISACELIIPPDRSVPRYNTVNGEKRRPELNPGGANFQGNLPQRDRVAAIESAYGDGRAFQASAAAPVAPVVTQQAAPQQVADIPASDRQRPSENVTATATSQTAPAPMVVASSDLAPPSDTYPTLNATPERPSAASMDNSLQRGAAIQGELQYDQSNAMSAREQVLKDAVAEPSLLANPPQMPNLPPPPPMNPAQATQVQKVKAQTPPAAAAPVPATAPAPVNGSAFERLTNQPLSTTKPVAPATPVAQEPIRLTPPSAITAAPAPVIAAAPAPVMAGGLSVPPDASTPIRPVENPVQTASPFASVDVKPAPQVAGIASPNPQASGSLEPIRLVPPGAAMAPASTGAVAATGTQTAVAQPVTSQRYIHNQAYLPASRYATMRQ